MFTHLQKNPVPKKGGKAVSTKTVEKNGEVHWELEKNKRVSVSEFKGKVKNIANMLLHNRLLKISDFFI